MPLKGINNPFQKNKKGVVIEESKKITNNKFNYENLKNLNKNDIYKLKICESEIKIFGKSYVESYKEICINLFKAQKIFVSKDKTKGQFYKWFESMGLKKSFVYRALERYNQFLITKKEVLLNTNISIRSIEIIKKIDNNNDKIKLTEKIENKELKTTKEIENYVKKNLVSHVGQDKKVKKIFEVTRGNYYSNYKINKKIPIEIHNEIQEFILNLLKNKQL